MRAYEYDHVVSFDETNLIGNVYYAHHIRWQGLCRERFLRDYAPEILSELERDLVLVTLRASCDYLGELRAFDSVTLRMTLAEASQNRLAMRFDYWRRNGGEVLVARGEQRVASMRRTGDALEPTPIPEALRRALRPFADSGRSVGLPLGASP